VSTSAQTSLNAAIVGLGWWGRRLVQSARSSKLIRFARGVTLEPDLVRDFCAEHKLAIGTSYEDVLADPAIQAVVLATPHSKHRMQVEAAAAAGRHVYCEKPFALSRADAERALAACARAGVTVAVGQHFRLMPSIQALRAMIENRELGTIMHAEGNYSHDWLAGQPAGHWRSQAEETRAGGMTGMGIHLLDAFSHLVGPMERISALSTRRALQLPTGDTTAALIAFSNGATGTLATTLKTPFVWRVAIYGADAWAESASETRLVICRAGGEPEVRDFEACDHLRMNLEVFAAAALERRAFPIDADGILHTVAALEAVFLSAEAKGAWQPVA
jgi:predicted dehydrogenase